MSISITDHVEVFDETGWVIATFPTVASARLFMDHHPHRMHLRYVDGPTCADCPEAPVANTTRGLRCVTHLEMDERLTRSQHPSR